MLSDLQSQPLYQRPESRWYASICTLLCLLYIITVPILRIYAHTTHSNTQRPFLSSQSNLFVDDLDGDGVDEWILIEGSSIFVTASDYLAIGKAYTRLPNTNTSIGISHIVTGSLLGRQQPRVLCAFANVTNVTPTPSTNLSCGVLHPARYEIEWFVNQPIPFRVNPYANSGISGSVANGVDVIIGDFDGDGKDEIVTYSSLDGSFSSYGLQYASSSSSPNITYQFILQSTSIPLVDSVTTSGGSSSSSIYGLTSSNQALYVGRFFDCSCPSSVSGADANPPSRCDGNLRRPINNVTIPPESIWKEPTIPHSPPNLATAPKRRFQLDNTTQPNSYATDDLMFADAARGVIQAFTSCVSTSANSRTPNFVRLLVTGSDFIRTNEQVSVANIRGRNELDDLVLFNPTTNQIRFYQFIWTIGSNGGRLERFIQNTGDLSRMLKKLRPSQPQLAWMRLQKPRVIQPTQEKGFSTVTITDSSSSGGVITVAHPSPASTSYYRLDVVIWNPSHQLLHFIVATYVTTIPKDRLQTTTFSTSSPAYANVDAQDDTLRTQVDAALLQSPSAWLGERSYVFSYSQKALNLSADQDGDAILTRYELGGLDPNRTGISYEPLHTYGCSPFRRDVLVEVDWMADDTKDMHPFNGFDQPAIEDLGAHGITLHVFLSSAIPRQENLGGSSYDWSRDFDPLKQAYFTPSRIGLFHYCIFIDRFDGGSVSGQSRTVPGNEFIISLGGWSNGHGILQQQQGTFLHELGHNLNLLHGGNDDVNWKPNHLSVMNYAFQVVGVQQDGTLKIMLSDFDCLNLNETELNEFQGVSCQLGRVSRGHSYATLVNGKWFPINQPLDFNQNGKIEHDVTLDLNGEQPGAVLTGAPNEYTRMLFQGLNPIPERNLDGGADFHTLATHLEDSNFHSHQRQLLDVNYAPQTELDYEQFMQLQSATTGLNSNHSNLASITSLPSSFLPLSSASLSLVSWLSIGVVFLFLATKNQVPQQTRV